VWKRIGSILRFTFDEEGCLGLDSTCFAATQHAKYVTGFLNSLIGNYLLSASPKTGTGDLLISVQAVEPILIPKDAETICTAIIDKILATTQSNASFEQSEAELDTILFDYFDFNDVERNHISKVAIQYRP
jgi:hypothetical protein